MANTVLITGASQGIGKATALLFARQGYDVVLAARQPERLEQVAAGVRAEGRQALAVPTYTSDVQQVEERRKQIQAMVQARWVSQQTLLTRFGVRFEKVNRR